MKKLLIVVSIGSLLSIVLGTLLFMHGTIGESQNKLIMLCATAVWFVVTPFWIKKKKA